MSTQPGPDPTGDGLRPQAGGAADIDGPRDEPALTVAAVARRLGVAPSTLRTWDRRYGLGPGGHTSGRHRRYDTVDVARLELMQHALLRGAAPAEAARYALSVRHPAPVTEPGDKPSGPAGGPARPDVPESESRVRVGGRVLRLPGACRRARGLARAVLAMDSASAYRLLAESVDTDGVVHTWDEVIRPVLGSVADRWSYTGAGVEVEHLLSECVIRVLAEVSAQAPAATSPRPVLLACVPAELHGLPLHALAAVLAQRGVTIRLLGTALPTDALAAAVRRTAPSVVFLWAQLSAHADAEVLSAVPRTRPRARVFAGGPGWEPCAVPPSVELLESLRQAADRIKAAALGSAAS